MGNSRGGGGYGIKPRGYQGLIKCVNNLMSNRGLSAA